MTTVAFFGLCALIESDNTFDASLPMVEQHRTVLFLAAAGLDIEGSSPPDLILNDPDGDQRVGWLLDKARLRFEGAAGKAKFSDTERAKFLDLREFHTRPKITPPQPNVFNLPEGNLIAGEADTFEVSFDGAIVHPAKAAAASAIWTGVFTTLVDESRGLKIKLNDGAQVTVSNLAPIKDGTGHFHHYYHFFDPQPPVKQVTIKHSTQSVRTMSVEVFDCVPPLPLP